MPIVAQQVHTQLIDTAIIFVTICATIVIGFVGYKSSKTLMGYIFANKTLGPWLLAFSIMATYFSAASFLGGGGATYLYNIGFGAWLTAWHVIGVVALWIIVADKLFDYISRNHIISVPELIGHRYNSYLARAIAAAIIVMLFSLYLVGVYKGGAVIISTQLGVDLWVAALILVVPVVVYIVIGGLRAAAINNLFLGMIMLIAASLTFGYIMYHVGGPVKGLEQLSQASILNMSGTQWLLLNGMGPQKAMEKGLVPLLIMSITFSLGMAQVALPNLLIQFYAARDRKAISRGRVIGPILVAVYAMLMFSLGAFCHLIIDPKLSSTEIAKLMRDPDWVIPRTVTMIAPIGVRGIILAAPVAASMSTIALTVLTISSTLLRDVVQPLLKINDERRLLIIAKIAAIVFAFTPIPIMLLENKIIVDIVGAAFGTIFACFLGPVVIGLYWGRASKWGAIASMISGAVTGILWYILLYRTTWIYPTIPAVLAALTLFIVLSLLDSKRKTLN